MRDRCSVSSDPPISGRRSRWAPSQMRPKGVGRLWRQLPALPNVGRWLRPGALRAALTERAWGYRVTAADAGDGASRSQQMPREEADELHGQPGA
jgi:hypothetical protein